MGCVNDIHSWKPPVIIATRSHVSNELGSVIMIVPERSRANKDSH